MIEHKTPFYALPGISMGSNFSEKVTNASATLKCAENQPHQGRSWEEGPISNS